MQKPGSVEQGPGPIAKGVAILVSAVFAVLAGYVEAKLAEILLTALLVFLGGFVSGILWPRAGWALGFLNGLAVPVAHGLLVEGAKSGSAAAPWLALVPAVIGGISGALLRQALRALTLG